MFHSALLLGLGLLPVLGQTAPAQPSPASATSTSPKTYLESDPRLNVRLTQRAGKTIFAEIWSQISRTAKVPIEREEAARELDDAHLAIGYHQMPARSVMDALAALTLYRWERTEKNGYRLLISQREMNVYKPKNPHQKDRYAQGLKFVQELDKLPAPEQNRIRAGEQVPLHSLPPEMRQAAEGVLEALNQELVSQGRSAAIELNQLVQGTTVRLRHQKIKNFNRYSFGIHVPELGGASISFSDYESHEREAQAARERKIQSGQSDALYEPVRFALSQDEARKLPALQKKVTVQMRDVTLPQVLRYLHVTYGVAYISDPELAIPQRASVNIVNLPLGKALDRLTQTYDNTEWEWRKSKFLVVRGPNNPSRTP